ncbi:FHA domain-containing protein [Thalassotalea sp. LPB0316]|uniref:FHA domain-containing protein n=1 Tax=Thalassotalea sp. LPB0316 TaxID=2769490 RepID=UPI0018664CD6|nr:FHA domain-containing protein [Thalassotalea sp. LPB0316]QOL26166.1 FHA domain-containing protein [Thalassotalea sp. LPB0316]
MAVIIIEQINRGQKLICRDRFDSNAIDIGRSYQNDIIIDDPHICPEHVKLSFDGEHWLVEDQGSINGSFLGDTKQNANQHILHSGDIISIGKSQLRVVFPDHPVSPTIKVSPFESLIEKARQPLSIALSLLLFTSLFGYLLYLGKQTEVTFTQLLVPAVGMTLGFSLWPSLVALISHLTKNDARYWSQIGVSFVIFNLFWLSDFIEFMLHFNLSSAWPVSWLTSLLPITLAFCLFWLNCYIGFHMSDIKRIVVSASLCLLIFGGAYLITLSNKPEFRERPTYDATIMTPNFLIAPSTPASEFIENAAVVFAKADEKVNED